MTQTADPARPLLLALDTATTTASLALYDTASARVLAETTWVAGREHSAQLLVETDRALTRAGRAVADVGGLAVACGPGSFTGVRVALSVAKGMAAGLRIPLWAVTTLDVLAHAAGATPLPVRPVVDAGRNRVATALYQGGARIEEMRGVAVADLSALITVSTVLIGDLTPDVRAMLQGVAEARLVSPAGSLRRAAYLAEVAWQAAQRGDPGDPAAADAVYLPPR